MRNPQPRPELGAKPPETALGVAGAVQAELRERETEVLVIRIAHCSRHQPGRRGANIGGNQAADRSRLVDFARLVPEVGLPDVTGAECPDRGELPADDRIVVRAGLLQNLGRIRDGEDREPGARGGKHGFAKQDAARVRRGAVAPGSVGLLPVRGGEANDPPFRKRAARVVEKADMAALVHAEAGHCLSVKNRGSEAGAEAPEVVARGKRIQETALRLAERVRPIPADTAGGLTETSRPIRLDPLGIVRRAHRLRTGAGPPAEERAAAPEPARPEPPQHHSPTIPQGPAHRPERSGRRLTTVRSGT